MLGIFTCPQQQTSMGSNSNFAEKAVKMLAVDFVLLLFLIIIVGFFISLPNFNSKETKIKLHERRLRSGKKEERDDARADYYWNPNSNSIQVLILLIKSISLWIWIEDYLNQVQAVWMYLESST